MSMHPTGFKLKKHKFPPISTFILAFIVLIVMALAVFQMRQSRDIRNKAADNIQTNSLIPEYAKGQVIFKLKKSASQAQNRQNINQQSLPPVIKNIQEKHGIKALNHLFKFDDNPQKEKDIDPSSDLGLSRQNTNEKYEAETTLSRIYKIEFDESIPVESIVNELNNSPDVEYAEPNYVYRTQGFPNDPDFYQLWGLNNKGLIGHTPDADIDAPEAWDITTGNNDVIVGIVDTGIDYTHPDLINNIWINPNEIPGNNIDDDQSGFIDDVHGIDTCNYDGDPFDDSGHGTHVAGIIGATGNNSEGVTGVIWNVKLMALKFLCSNGRGYTSDAMVAIYYASTRGVKTINASWGSYTYSQSLYDLLFYLKTNDQLFVAGAGNDGHNNDYKKFYPASYDLDNIISVAASDEWDYLADFSNYGASTVHLMAPGTNILSTVPNGFYTSYSGTSMATPFVSGATLLVHTKYPDDSMLAVKNRILQFVDKKDRLSSQVSSGGRLNVNNTLRNVMLPTPTPIPTATTPIGIPSLPENPRCPNENSKFGVYYGHIYIDNLPATNNDTIWAVSPSGGVVGCQISKGSIYPYMRVYGEDGSGTGMLNGQDVTFYINDKHVSTNPSPVIWHGDLGFNKVDLYLNQITPTPDPTATPTEVPTATPTTEPTPVPTDTPVPTNAPTATPTPAFPKVQNYSFEVDTDSNLLPDKWTANRLTSSDKLDTRYSQQGKSSFLFTPQVSGNTARKTITQSLYYTIGQAGQTVALDVWHHAERNSGAVGSAGVILQLVYADGSTSQISTNFPKTLHSWQKSTTALTALKPYRKINVTLFNSNIYTNYRMDNLNLRLVN